MTRSDLRHERSSGAAERRTLSGVRERSAPAPAAGEASATAGRSGDEATHADLLRLVAAQQRLRDDERTRIARQLHDDVAQSLAMLSITLGMAGRAPGEEPERLAELLADATSLADSTVVAARRVMRELHPRPVHELGLADALRVLAASFAVESGVACDIVIDPGLGDPGGLDPDPAGCLYDVAQGALAHLATTGFRAREVRLALSRRSARELVLSVGVEAAGVELWDGFPAEAAESHGIGERLRAAGGRLQRVPPSAAAGVTTLTAAVPVARPA